MAAWDPAEAVPSDADDVFGRVIVAAVAGDEGEGDQRGRRPVVNERLATFVGSK